MKYSVAAVVSASLASIVAGQGCSTKADGPNAGNPIRAPLSQIVPAGTPFTIKWDNTTPGSVAIELLRGPSTNVVPIRCLTEGIVNTGEFVWTPSSDLEADISRYGLRIIVTNGAQKGTFQYSNQFGISNDVVHPPTSSSSNPSTPTTKAQTATTAASQASDGQVEVPTTLPTSTQASTTSFIPVIANVTTTAAIISTPIVSIPISNSSVVIATTHIPIPVPVVPSGSGFPPTTLVLQPTNSMTVPASLQTSAPTRVTASASASFVSSSRAGTGSPIVGPSGTSAPISGAGKVLAGSMFTALGALGAFLL